jgi:DNA-binding MarR family transcriptional regulator
MDVSFLIRKQRLNILTLLLESPKTVYQIIRFTGMSPPNLLHSLDILKKAGIINVEIKGRAKEISLTEKGRQIAAHLKAVKELLGG